MKGPRVAAGTAGGLFLRVPRRFASRPTQDRVKQALFSSLGALVPEARVLDLCAGTGALGIEALSRGAACCVFVEKDPACIETIKANLQHCRLQGTVIRQDAESYLSAAPAAAFDLILLDPPYLKMAHNLAQSPWLPALARILDRNGVLIWEHDALNSWQGPAALEVFRSVRYGETVLTSLRHPTGPSAS